MKGGYLFLALVSLLLEITVLWVWEANQRAIPSSAQNNANLGSTKLTKSEKISLNPSSGKEPNPEMQYTQGIRPSSKRKVCNYAKGRWVADSRRPLYYSGFSCKQFLFTIWSCRLTPRPDFSFEEYRWQPQNCDLPQFERSAFLRKMQDKTVAFIGDSLGAQQFQSLMCMATGGEESPEVENVGWKYGLARQTHGSTRPDGFAYRFPNTNTTILFYFSATLCDQEPLINITNQVTNVALHLDTPVAFLRKFIHQFDVLILNTGHHWNRLKLNANRWVMYVDGKPNEDKKRDEIDNAKNFTIYSVAKWVNLRIASHPSRLEVFFRTLSPRHFFDGEWNTGGRCDNRVPLSRGSEVVQDGSSDAIVEGALMGTKIKILDISAISQLRDEAHMSRYTIKGVKNSSDCLHWCLPGVPDTWNEILVSHL